MPLISRAVSDALEGQSFPDANRLSGHDCGLSSRVLSEAAGSGRKMNARPPKTNSINPLLNLEFAD